MAWYDDLWSGIKDVVNVGKDVVSTVAPLLPLILKKGGTVKDFKDTPENRKKILKAFNKVHKTKLTMKQLEKVMSKKMAKK
jgi:hypothetical protein